MSQLPVSSKSKKEQALLEASQAVFEAKGLESATIDEICEGAGVSRPTFYKHFKDKNQLFVGYVLFKARAIVDYLESLAADVTDKESFFATSKRYSHFMYRDDILAFHGMVAGEARFNDEVRMVFRNYIVKRHAQQRQMVIMKLIIAGLIQPTRDITELSSLLGALVTSDAYYLTVAGGKEKPAPEDLEQFVERRSELFLQMAAHITSA